MTGGLYRSANAAQDGDPELPETGDAAPGPDAEAARYDEAVGRYGDSPAQPGPYGDEAGRHEAGPAGYGGESPQYRPGHEHHGSDPSPRREGPPQYGDPSQRYNDGSQQYSADSPAYSERSAYRPDSAPYGERSPQPANSPDSPPYGDGPASYGDGPAPYPYDDGSAGHHPQPGRYDGRAEYSDARTSAPDHHDLPDHRYGTGPVQPRGRSTLYGANAAAGATAAGQYDHEPTHSAGADDPREDFPRFGDGMTAPGDATLISSDEAVPGAAAAEQQALPPQEPASSTAGQSAIMAVGSLVSRLIGFVRNALIGMTLGSAVGDAYTSAQFLPSQIYELLLGGILSSVLIPLLVRRRKADPDDGQAYTQKLLTFAMVCLGVATLLVVAAAPVITAIQAGSGTSQDYRQLVTWFAYLILPIIFFTGLSALIGAVLNVRGHFAAPMWAPILNNLVVIATCGVFLIVFGTDTALTPENITPGRIALIGGGTLLGVIVQAAGLLPALRKVGFTWNWRWDPRGLGLREIGQLAGWMLCYVGANQVAVFVVVNVLSGVSGANNASVLAFNNVYLLTMMAHGIIGVSVMTALLPKMSSAAAEGRYADVSADVSRGIRLTATALAPIAVVYGVLAVPIAVTLFQGGRFTPEMAYATGGVLVVAAFAVLPLSISYLCTYAFYALQGNKTVALINLPVVGIRIAGYVVLSAVLSDSLTAAGMTGANALSYVLSALISLALLRRRIGRLNLGSLAAALLKVLAAAAVAAALGLLVLRFLPGGDEPSRLQALVQLAVGGAVIMLGYLLAATVLRVREVGQVVSMVRRKLGR